RRPESVEQPVDGRRVTHVADHGLDRRRDDVEQRRLLGGVHEAAHAFALAGEGPHQVLAEPARGSGDDGNAGSFRVGSHRNCLADRPDAHSGRAGCRPLRTPGRARAAYAPLGFGTGKRKNAAATSCANGVSTYTCSTRPLVSTTVADISSITSGALRVGCPHTGHSSPSSPSHPQLPPPRPGACP